MFKKSVDFIRTGKRVSARVVELESYKDSEGGMLYRPIFQYKEGHVEQRYVYNVGSRPAAWRIGDEADLIISNKNAEEIKVLTYFGVFNWSIILISIALPLIFIAFGYFWANRFFQNLMASS
jgi:hypothetical protein